MAEYGKNRQWTCVAYNENMREDWREEVDNLLQLPFAYCVHDKGLQLEKNERRKVHTHFILVFPSPTTYKHAMEVFGRLNAEGKRAFNTIEPVYAARQMYDYLIHDTADCRKKGKYLFDKAERITGNNYDIGAYEQVSQQDKNEAFDKLVDLVFTEEVTNFADFVLAVRTSFPEEQELMRDVMRGYSGYFDRLIKGNFFRVGSFNPAKNSKPASEAGADQRPHDAEMTSRMKEVLQSDQAQARELAYALEEKEAKEEAEYFDRLTREMDAKGGAAGEG